MHTKEEYINYALHILSACRAIPQSASLTCYEVLNEPRWDVDTLCEKYTTDGYHRIRNIAMLRTWPLFSMMASGHSAIHRLFNGAGV